MNLSGRSRVLFTTASVFLLAFLAAPRHAWAQG